jgi:hypothetical protein
MSDHLIREIEATSNITVRLHTEVTDGHGEDHLDALCLRDRSRPLPFDQAGRFRRWRRRDGRTPGI